MTLTLLRHAEVVPEYHGCYNGHIDIGLSQKGKESAKALAHTMQNMHFDAIFCSDLLRAKETLRLLDLPLSPHYSSALREKSWGEYEGKSFQEITATGLSYENFTQWIEALGGESIALFEQRVLGFFTSTIFTHPAENILIVTHSGVIKTLLAKRNNISLQEAFSEPFAYANYIQIEKESLNLKRV